MNCWLPGGGDILVADLLGDFFNRMLDVLTIQCGNGTLEGGAFSVSLVVL